MKTTTPGTKMTCLECDHQFRHQFTARTTSVKCPNCGSRDTEVMSGYYCTRDEFPTRTPINDTRVFSLFK